VRGGSEASWWRKTRALALTTLAIGAIVAVAANAAADAGPPILDLPLGLFAGVIVAPLALAAATFAYAARQQRLDRDFDVAGD